MPGYLYKVRTDVRKRLSELERAEQKLSSAHQKMVSEYEQILLDIRDQKKVCLERLAQLDKQLKHP